MLRDAGFPDAERRQLSGGITQLAGRDARVSDPASSPVRAARSDRPSTSWPRTAAGRILLRARRAGLGEHGHVRSCRRARRETASSSAPTGRFATRSPRHAWHGDAVPVAVGALPFGTSRDAVLSVPAHAVRRTADGVTRERSSAGDDRTSPFDRPTAVLRTARRVRGDAGRARPFAGRVCAARSRPPLERLRDGVIRKVVLARTHARWRRDACSIRGGWCNDCARWIRTASRSRPRPERGASSSAHRRSCWSLGRGSEVRANPLAGSAPRSGDPDEDRANAEALGSSAKDRQEHAIVVEAVFAALQPLCTELRYDRRPRAPAPRPTSGTSPRGSAAGCATRRRARWSWRRRSIRRPRSRARRRRRRSR